MVALQVPCLGPLFLLCSNPVLIGYRLTPLLLIFIAWSFLSNLVAKQFRRHSFVKLQILNLSASSLLLLVKWCFWQSVAAVLPHLLSRRSHKIYLNLWEVYLHSMLYGNLPFSELKFFVNLWENKTHRYTQLYLQQQHCVGYFPWFSTGPSAFFHPLWRRYGNAALVEKCRIRYHKQWGCYSPMLDWMSQAEEMLFSSVGLITCMVGGGELNIASCIEKRRRSPKNCLSCKKLRKMYEVHVHQVPISTFHLCEFHSSSSTTEAFVRNKWWYIDICSIYDMQSSSYTSKLLSRETPQVC